MKQYFTDIAHNVASLLITKIPINTDAIMTTTAASNSATIRNIVAVYGLWINLSHLG